MTEQNDNQEGNFLNKRDCNKELSQFYRTASPDIYPILKEYSIKNRKESTLYEAITIDQNKNKKTSFGRNG